MKMLKITLQGRTYEVAVEVVGSATVSSGPVAMAPAAMASAPAPMAAPVAAAPAPAPALAEAPSAGGQSVTSPMPGIVFKISVAVGDAVTPDQELIVLDAMKMESPVYAPCAGTVASILVKEGEAVVEGQVLIQIS